ncbi:PKD domain-containing protein [Desulfonema magnum]|uniref:PKD domain-containing protein n=1 Tax=Desulfonema magnum TaxID=45655 RepID=A0A975BLC9_9BACT|nr:PKD domain-containing protein [Desulfonema magnum]QTA87697.1 PKD domain-containing protein [Desulfonema magnum]
MTDAVINTRNLTADVVFDDAITNVEQMRSALQESNYSITSVTYENASPEADAGHDLVVGEGDIVTLDGSESDDPDKNIVSYEWTQTFGIPVMLSDAGAVQPFFTAPDVSPDGDSLTFKLTVTDQEGLQSTDECVVNITHTSGVTRLTPQEAKDMIDTNENLMLVDVREPDELCGEYGHIPDSLNYPWDSGVFQEKYQELPGDTGILVICRTGRRSSLAAEFLDAKGFTDVYDIGGMGNWEWEIMTCSDEAPMLSAAMNADGSVSLNWSQYTGTSFESYILLRNTSPAPEYPDDEDIWSEDDVTVTNYNDETPLTGTSYYRLTVVRTNGDTLYSDSVQTDIAAPLTISLSVIQTTGYAPLNVDFTATASGGAEPYIYTWDFDDGSIPGDGESLTYTYSDPGTYAVKVTVADTNGDTVTASVNITVTEKEEPPIADAGSDQVADEGATVTLDASGSYDPNDGSLSYFWEQTGGISVELSDPSLVHPSFTAPDVGIAGETLTFRVTVTDEAGSQAAATSVVSIAGLNSPPVADAGSDQTADEGDTVTLDASGSYDPDGGTLSYLWEQTGGTEVSLSDAAAVRPSFTAPDVGIAGETLTFRVTVTDEAGSQAAATSVVSIAGLNSPPVADAGSDQTADEGDTVTLDASASYDPDGGTVNYLWEQTGGTEVSLSDAAAVRPNFTAPDVDVAGETLTFRVTVTDEAGSQAAATSVVSIAGLNSPPVADAGSDQTADEGDTVTLDASASYDPDGGTLSYLWEQTGGTEVSLSDAAAVRPNFTAPDVDVAGETLTFRVTVTDEAGSQAAATSVVSIAGLNSPPVADAGSDQTADEGDTVTLDASASYDPDGDALSYLWEQTDGTVAELSDSSVIQPSFTVPDVETAGDPLTFRLTVTDEAGLQATDNSVVNVNDVTAPPSDETDQNETVDDDDDDDSGSSCFVDTAGHSSQDFSPVSGLVAIFFLGIAVIITRLD